jgi:hypothetical protein
MPKSTKDGWKREPYAGELLYHLKWTHGVWVSNDTKSDRLDAIHRQLHGPRPEGWIDNGTWEPGHRHDFPPVQPELPTEENGDSWTW